MTRIGAQAALNVFDKYMNNMSICEIYYISLGELLILNIKYKPSLTAHSVMCPDVKLNWLHKHYDSQSVDRIYQMVCARFHILNSTMEESKELVSEKLNAKVNYNLYNLFGVYLN